MGFHKKIKPGDFLVAGDNFGCGSSREQAVTCLKVSGISAIVARSFARIYYRNCINSGLPAIIHPEASEEIKAGDVVEVDLERGTIKSGGKIYTFPPYPEKIKAILEAGGIIPYIKKTGVRS